MSNIVDMFTFTDADFVQTYVYQTAAGDPVDLTDHTMRLHARKHAADHTAMFECSTDNGRIWWNDIEGGMFTVQIPLTVLSILAPGTYVQSLIATYDNPNIAGEPFLRREIWRGGLVHAAGPTRWDLNVP